MKQSPTNELTQFILKDLYSRGIFAWRNNTSGVPLPGGGMRPAAKTGVPDILCLTPRTMPFLAGVEVKTGSDRLRPEQEGFIASAGHVGSIVLVVHTKEDYLQKLSTALSTIA